MTVNDTQPTDKLVEILLVEDNEADIELTKEGLLRGHLANRLHITRDGEEAMAFLYRNAKFATAPRPDLVLLDLNLPKKDGREVLAEMKRDENLKTIPVVVLTTSDSEKDILHAYSHYVNAYITKPVDFHKFVDVVSKLTNYWFTLVTLPPHRLNQVGAS
jgi:two-component system, chemotaxis family, response regulator Rcp1